MHFRFAAQQGHLIREASANFSSKDFFPSPASSGFGFVCGSVIPIRAGATLKKQASQCPKWFFPKMPPFSSWYIPRHKSLTVVHDLLRFGGCRAIFLYLMLFSATFSPLERDTSGLIMWAQTPSNWPHHGSSFCQAWPKEYSCPWEGWDLSQQARGTVYNAWLSKWPHLTHSSFGLSAPIPSSTKAGIFLGSCLTKATSMVGSIGGSLGSQNLPQSPFL